MYTVYHGRPVFPAHCSPQWPNAQCANTCTKTVVGGFELLCDEAAEQAKAKGKDGAGGHNAAADGGQG